MARTRATGKGDKLIEQLRSGGPAYFGMLKVAEADKDAVMFSAGRSCAGWVRIPVDSIDNVEMLHLVPCSDHDHPYVKLRLKAAEGVEAALFSRLAALHAAPFSIGPQGVRTGRNCHWDEIQHRVVCDP